MSRSILVTTDAFRTGGRETFLETMAGLLRAHEPTRLSLIADDIRNPIVDAVFDTHIEPGAEHNGGAWLAAGADLVDGAGVDLVWAQHYKTLAAWLLCAVHGRPLLVTFHGPPLGAGYVTSPLDALGIVLSIHRGGLLSAVSEEVRAELTALGAAPGSVRIMPNRVRIPHDPGVERLPPRRSDPNAIRLVMLSRRQKLDHMRAGLFLLLAIRKLGRTATLTIHSDVTTGSAHAPTSGSFQQLATLFGRKWLLAHPRLWPVLAHVTLAPATTRPQAVIDAADAVVGMGRVVLEAAAMLRPAVLTGYSRNIDLLSAGRFEEFQHTNFSGRGVAPRPLEEIAHKLIHTVDQPDQELSRLARLVDADAQWSTTKEIFQEAFDMQAPPLSAASEPGDLVALFERASSKDKVRERCSRHQARAMLRPAERQAFDMLLDR